MVTLENANKVLKEVYLDVLARHLNEYTNVFYNKIQKNSENISNGFASAIARHGINGGIGITEETADLPQAGGNAFIRLKAEMRNIYGTIELTDKALRVSGESSNGLISILNDEMEGLLGAAKYNFARMLFQDGNGVIAKITDRIDDASLSQDRLPIDSTKHIIEGMIIDVVAINGTKKLSKLTVRGVDRVKKEIIFDDYLEENNIKEGDIVCLQNSYMTEIYGIPYIFLKTRTSVYGASRLFTPHLFPTYKETNAITSDVIQETMDDIDEAGGSDIDLLICSYDVRRSYFNHLAQTRMNIDYMNLDGGFKALSYNGIPLVADRFAPEGKMYLLNTDDYRLAQLNDWDWIKGSTGQVLRQMDNKAAYSATLVKYANLMCIRPLGQGEITVTKSSAGED